jgi:hypothetical protein
MAPTRRDMLIGAGAAGASLFTAGKIVSAHDRQAALGLSIAVKSPWMANQVALTSDNILFLGLPRYTRDQSTPSLVRREADGALRPFPGNGWNMWQPGKDGREAFVYINAVHIFADDTVWCVDQGAPNEDIFPGYGKPAPGAQKIVQLDARSGAILRILR